ncbi:CrpP-related protein [Achromobacter xylosoxidans]|uniref:CrpP-related protein n=3 Tax=Alcaligenaceae TaxID=506 RepID=UPI003709725E
MAQHYSREGGRVAPVLARHRRAVASLRWPAAGCPRRSVSGKTHCGMRRLDIPASHGNTACGAAVDSIRVCATLTVVSNDENHGDIPHHPPYSTPLTRQTGRGGFAMKDAARHMGYRAAARGQSLESCPFMRADKLPTRTGENLTHWREKVEAWEHGWHECVNARLPLIRDEAKAADKAPEKDSSH